MTSEDTCPDFTLKCEGRYLGKAFTGHAFAVPVDGADAFYAAHDVDMIESGRRSFLSSMRIPKSFFEERNPTLRGDLVVDTKHTTKEKRKTESLFVLVIDGAIAYVAPDLPGTLGWEGPEDTMKLDTTVWGAIHFDVGCGMVQYVFQPNRDEYASRRLVPAAFLSIPIFYTKGVQLTLGLYDMQSQSMALDSTFSAPCSIKPGFLTPERFRDLRGAMTRAAKTLHTVKYGPFLDLMDGPLGLSEAKDALNALLEQDKCPVPTRIVKKSLQHLELLKTGKPVPRLSPDTQSSWSDLLEIFLFYAQQTKKMVTRNTVNRKILDYFANACAPNLVPKKPVELFDYVTKDSDE